MIKMIVNTQTLLKLPVGTFFHNVEDCSVYEIREITIGVNDLYVRPIFHGLEDYLRRLHLDRWTIQEKENARWYIINQEDKKKIAQKMGFEPCGIMIIGLK